MVFSVEAFNGGIKGLPRQDGTGLFLNVFEANGKKYRMVTDQDDFPIDRWTQFLKFRFAVLSGMEYEDMMTMCQAHMKVVNRFAARDAEYTDVVLSAAAIDERIRNLAGMNHTAAILVSTLFIYREGEGPNDWNFALASEKIDDWAKEGFGMSDFLSLSLFYMARLTDTLLMKSVDLAIQLAGGAKAQKNNRYTTKTNTTPKKAT